MNTQQTEWQIALAAWIAQTDAINARAKAITRTQQDKGWKLAQSVGIGRCGCSLHNASIDDDMKGWCKDNPERLRIAKLASRLVNDWRASRAAERMNRKSWNTLLHPLGAPKSV